MIDYNKINYDSNIFQNDGIDEEIDDTDDEFILNINDKNKFDTNFNNNNNNYLNKLNNTLFNSFNLIDYFKNDTPSSSSSSSSSLSSASSSSSSSSSYVNTMPNTKFYNDDIIVNHIINNDPTFNNNYNIKTIGFDTDDNIVNNYGINTIFNINGIGNNNEKQFNIFSAAATTAAAVTTTATSSSYDYNQLDLLNEYSNSNNTILLNLSNNITNSSILYDDDTLLTGRCPDFSDQDFARFEFWICGVILNFVGLLGILGNILSMIILSRPQMRSSINYLLIGLARCDTVLIITSILLFGIPSIYPYTGYLFYYYYYIYPNISPCMFPIAMAAQTSSVYMTFTVTLERYVAVCHPLKARALCTYGRAKIYFIICILFAFVYNIPRFWEVIVITDTLNYNNNNVPIFNNINNLHNINNSHFMHHFGSNGNNAPNIDGINSNSNSGSSGGGARNPTLINTISFGDDNVGNSVSSSSSNSNSHTNRMNSNSNSFYNNNNNNNYNSNSNNNINFDDSGGIGELFLNNNNNNSYDNIITNNDNNDNDNGNNVIFCVVASSLRRNDQYINIYIHWCYLIFIYFIPFLSLAILNCLIYRQVQKANRERQRLSRTERREIGLATMLLCVVIVFFLFNFLALYTNILEAFYDIIDDYLIKISNLLVTINSSANFIIYVIFGEKFKRIFFLLFCKGRMSRDQPDLIHYESSISNGEGNNRSSGRFSRHGTQRSTTAISLNRGNNNIMNSNNNINNNNNNSNNNNNGIPTSVRITTKRIKRNRAPSPGPCVYYPARDVQRTQTVITPSSSLQFDCYNNKNGGMMTSGF